MPSSHRLLLLLFVAALSLYLVDGAPTSECNVRRSPVAGSHGSLSKPPSKPSTLDSSKSQQAAPHKDIVIPNANAPKVQNSKPEKNPLPPSSNGQPSKAQQAAPHKDIVTPNTNVPKAQNSKPEKKPLPPSPNGKPTDSGKTFKSYADAVKNGQPKPAGAEKKGQGKTASAGQPKKPCPHPRGHHKRAPGDDCEEWDDTNLVMKQDGHPNVAADNPAYVHWGKTWKYTDAQHQGKELAPNRVKEMDSNVAQAQKGEYQKIANQPGPKPWKKKQPGASGLTTQKDHFAPGVHQITGSTSMTKRPNAPADAKPVAHPEVQKLQDESRGQRFPANSALHHEEVSGSQRAHNGQAPFRNAWVTTHETEDIKDPSKPSEPMHSCKGNCEKIVEHGDGIDLYKGIPPTSKQRAKAQAKKDKKAGKVDEGQKPRTHLDRVASQAGSQISSSNPYLDEVLGAESSSGASSGDLYQE